MRAVVELPGQDHFPWAGDTDAIVEEVRAFLTGTRGSPKIRTASSPRSCSPTSSARPQRAASMGDRNGRTSSTRTTTRSAASSLPSAVVRSRQSVTGSSRRSTDPRGIRCARAVRTAASDLHIDVRVGLHTGEIELRGDDIGGLAVHIGQRVRPPRNRPRSWCRAPSRTSSRVRHRVRGPRRAGAEGRARELAPLRRHQLTSAEDVDRARDDEDREQQ